MSCLSTVLDALLNRTRMSFEFFQQYLIHRSGSQSLHRSYSHRDMVSIQALLRCQASFCGSGSDHEPLSERILIEGYREASGESRRIPPERIAFQ